jgi:hypothetical protein
MMKQPFDYRLLPPSEMRVDVTSADEEDEEDEEDSDVISDTDSELGPVC